MILKLPAYFLGSLPSHTTPSISFEVRKGEIVSISALVSEGQRGVTVPFGRDTLTLADGAPQLSRRTGARLLCVFTVRLDEAVVRAAEAYARDLELVAAVAPDQLPLFTRAFERR